MDLVEPVREQMASIKAHSLPATWLLQYDAMVEGPFVEFLKNEMPNNHVVCPGSFVPVEKRRNKP
jgi:hypothetical protein